MCVCCVLCAASACVCGVRVGVRGCVFASTFMHRAHALAIRANMHGQSRDAAMLVCPRCGLCVRSCLCLICVVFACPWGPGVWVWVWGLRKESAQAPTPKPWRKGSMPRTLCRRCHQVLPARPSCSARTGCHAAAPAAPPAGTWSACRAGRAARVFVCITVRKKPQPNRSAGPGPAPAKMKAWYTGSSLLLLAVPAAAPGPTPFLGLPLLLPPAGC